MAAAEVVEIYETHCKLRKGVERRGVCPSRDVSVELLMGAKELEALALVPDLNAAQYRSAS